MHHGYYGYNVLLLATKYLLPFLKLQAINITEEV